VEVCTVPVVLVCYVLTGNYTHGGFVGVDFVDYLANHGYCLAADGNAE